MTNHSTHRTQLTTALVSTPPKVDDIKDPKGLKAWLWFAGLWLGGFASVTVIGMVVKGLIRLAM